MKPIIRMIDPQYQLFGATRTFRLVSRVVDNDTGHTANYDATDLPEIEQKLTPFQTTFQQHGGSISVDRSSGVPEVTATIPDGKK